MNCQYKYSLNDDLVILVDELGVDIVQLRRLDDLGGRDDLVLGAEVHAALYRYKVFRN